ncbi:MAG: hypothetical protein QOG21_1225 [Actinomycetota bacterium]|jgi:hypothetical protein|nr:hypothetical protein [Actinomycetota bacterium]
MFRTAYLRVYEPLALFPARERSRWSVQSGEDDGSDILASRKWLITAALPGQDASSAMDERAFIRRIDDRILVCPWRTRLRMLTSLLAFRGVVPDEVADAFVPEMEAQRAARELATMDEETPEIRSHILHANWHVPLRWFGAFEDAERILVEDKAGLRLRYETSTGEARARLRHTLGVLEASQMDEGVTEAVRELLDWLSVFSDEGLVELDYGTVALMFDDEELLEDRSAGELWQCLQALEEGDTSRAGRIFATLSERWSEVRSLEILN